VDQITSYGFSSTDLGNKATSRYKIRKSSRSDSLSTLEACAYMLKALDEGLDVNPLLVAFDAMVAMRLQAMPAEVRLRYD
ncbi:MAG: DTW domain-containing protein, partial [Shewanella sp.]|uniref:DTW domain-containing protein n=1 Tax=Shewanella sp. TaxID=50422 RepID=UPI002649AFCC